MTTTELCPSCDKPIVHREGVDWCRDRQMSERTLQERVRGKAKRRGWIVAHVGKGVAAFDAAGNPVFVTAMSVGWPDLFLIRPSDGRRLAIELKSEYGKLSDEQIAWLQNLNAVAIPAVVVRPSDLREKRVDAILK